MLYTGYVNVRQTGLGMVNKESLSALFQKPGKVNRVELPRTGFSAAAGFVIIVAGKKAGERALVG